MANTIKFDAGGSSDPYPKADNNPDLTGNSSYYLTFKADPSYPFDLFRQY